MDVVIKGGSVLNSYSKEFFKEFKYISDSRMHWREDVLGIIRSNKEKKLHILTHPIWYSHNQKEINNILYEFIKNANSCRYEHLKNNFANLEEYIRKSDIV